MEIFLRPSISGLRCWQGYYLRVIIQYALQFFVNIVSPLLVKMQKSAGLIQ